MTRRIVNAVIGFALGLVTLPLALVAWPVALAVILYNDVSDDVEVIA